MDDLRTSFDEGRYPNRYVLEVPNRQGRQIYAAIEKFIAERGIDARVTYRTNSDNGALTWDIGIATTEASSYMLITQHLDQKMHGWMMDHIAEIHGPGHPLNRYVKQLGMSLSAGDFVQIASEFSSHIDDSRRAAVEAAYREFETARSQWPEPAEGLHQLLE